MSLMSVATLQISCVYLNTFQRGVLTPMIECTLSTITQRQHSGKTLEPKGEWQKNTTDKLCQCGLLDVNINFTVRCYFVLTLLVATQ